VFLYMGGGIGVADGAEAVVRENTCHHNLRGGIGCRNSSPFVLHNSCYENVRAGIGCREGAAPVLRGNRCYCNRRAGIGIRMAGTRPVVEDNKCFENAMAGIGCRDGAEPVLRGNECRANEMAGIGVEHEAHATILKNRCVENKLVAIGVVGGSSAVIADNELVRTGGVPPLVAVKDGSSATLRNNRITGGGVAAVLVQGTAHLEENEFQGRGGDQGAAVWVWDGSTVVVNDNRFDGYRHAMNAKGSRVTATDNTIRKFGQTAIVVKSPSAPACVMGNAAYSSEPGAQVVDVEGQASAVRENSLHGETQP
jgi:hypothetical protein